MYGLKDTVDLSFLFNTNVEQICVSNSALIVNFDKAARLTILSSFAVSTPEQPLTRFDGYAEDAKALFPIIGDVVTEAKATVSGGLQITFHSGAFLEVFDDSDQFESFWINNGDQLIVV